MRLIDADKIKFTEYVNGDITVSKEEIQNMPTAYDVDKVIERINCIIAPTQECIHQFCGTVKARHCIKYENCEDCMAERMIEIVKSGGVEKEKGERE